MTYILEIGAENPYQKAGTINQNENKAFLFVIRN